MPASSAEEAKARQRVLQDDPGRPTTSASTLPKRQRPVRGYCKIWKDDVKAGIVDAEEAKARQRVLQVGRSSIAPSGTLAEEAKARQRVLQGFEQWLMTGVYDAEEAKARQRVLQDRVEQEDLFQIALPKRQRPVRGYCKEVSRKVLATRMR